MSAVNDGIAESLQTVVVNDLTRTLGFREPLQFPDEWRLRPVTNWTMESDDMLLRYIFRNFRPQRHLEFGTWEGDGVLRCVEECEATVWTINLLEGERRANGEWAYSSEAHRLGPAAQMGEELVTRDATWVHTDAYGLIGHKYLSRDYGSRVWQIYDDSRRWDIRHYPDGFFDTAFIDGGHTDDVVRSDTRNAIALVRAGGLVMWHDFCPRLDARQANANAARVTEELYRQWPAISEFFERLFWVEPSWLLIGERNHIRLRRERGAAPQ